MPSVITFLDVETTGLTSEDRVVSFGGIKADLRTMTASTIDLSVTYLAFNPEKKSHWAARKVHGFSDEDLAFQQGFSERAQEIKDFIESADLAVGHNLDFDIKFIDREMHQSGLSSIKTKKFCTMAECRERFVGERATLDVAGARAGAFRLSTERHSAIEDAWITMQVYFWLHGQPFTTSFLRCPQTAPENWRGVQRNAGSKIPTKKRGRPRKAAAISTSTFQPPGH